MLALCGTLSPADLGVAAPRNAVGQLEECGVIKVARDGRRQAWLLAAQGNLFQACDILVEAAQAARRSGHLTSEAMLLTDADRLGAAKDVRARLSELAALATATSSRQECAW
jgi:hypothetical protein